jgi:topoisomerase-4 subunit A
VLLGTSGGNALRAKVESLVTRIRAGKQFVSVAEGESQVTPSIIPAGATEVAALSGEGRLLVFPLEEGERASQRRARRDGGSSCTTANRCWARGR